MKGGSQNKVVRSFSTLFFFAMPKRKGKHSKSKKRKPNVKNLSEKAQELVKLLEAHGAYVPEAPTLNDCKEKKTGYDLQKKGNGTGNTKNDKKVMKRFHHKILTVWIESLEKEVDKLNLGGSTSDEDSSDDDDDYGNERKRKR